MGRSKIAGAALLAATSLFAQGGNLSAGGGPAWKGLEILFATRIEPAGGGLSGGVSGGAGRVHHIIDDPAHKRAFGYDIALEPAPDGQSAQIRIEPLHPAQSQLRFDPGWTFLELPNYPVIPGVKVGDTVALDLLINAASGQKVVDYLTLRRHGDMDFSRPPRDFQLSDVELTLLDPQVFLDGKPEPAMHGGGIGGSVIWMYLKGRGRFTLSLLPNEKFGFRKNGAVSANGLLFHDGATEIRVTGSRQVAPGSGTYNLYLVREPAWRPERPVVFAVGSADLPELVIGKK